MDQADRALPSIDYRTEPERYRHWRLLFDGPVATLLMDVQEGGGIRPGYTLKLNSYDLGVDIELHDAVERIRFEHPEVRAIVIGTAKARVFCSGANIYMLGSSSHAWKVNFCKFTNETRNSIEDASRFSGLKFIAACKGAAAGGGYELALACDEIVLVDDRSSAVSLPEVPLLGVLPGTGGLTRVTDKRRVRRDLADVFCTSPDGAKGSRAKDWGLVDAVVKPDAFDAYVADRARACAAGSDRPPGERGIVLSPLARTDDEAGYHYEYVDVTIDARKGVATLTVSAPEQSVADTARRHRRRRRALVATRDGPRVGRCDSDAAHESHECRTLDRDNARRSVSRAGQRCGAPGASGALVRSRGRWACCGGPSPGSRCPRGRSTPSSGRTPALPAASSNWRWPPIACTCWLTAAPG